MTAKLVIEYMLEKQGCILVLEGKTVAFLF